MQNENKQPHWKEKLNDTGMLSPDTALNKEVSWEVLHHRLQNKSKLRKARLYWVAAACILPFLFVMMFLLFRSKGDNLKSVVHQNIITKPSLAEKKTLQNEKEMVSPQVTLIKKKMTPEQNVKKAPLITPEEKPETIVTDSAAPEEVITLLPAADDSLDQPLIAAAQQKKKLPVVHINELNEPVAAIPMLAQNRSRHYFPLQIAHGEVAGKEIKTISKTGFINFKASPSTN